MARPPRLEMLNGDADDSRESDDIDGDRVSLGFPLKVRVDESRSGTHYKKLHVMHLRDQLSETRHRFDRVRYVDRLHEHRRGKLATEFAQEISPSRHQANGIAVRCEDSREFLPDP